MAKNKIMFVHISNTWIVKDMHIFVGSALCILTNIKLIELSSIYHDIMIYDVMMC